MAELGNFYLVVAVFIGMATLFFSGRVGLDLAALFSLLVLVILGLISTHEALQGFASEAVILMVTSFFLSGALRLSGVGDRIGRFMASVARANEARAVAITVVIAALLSSIMNNVAATAVMLPAVAALARHAQVKPAKLFLPLSFAVLLGGTTTLIGTSSNMLASEVLKQNNLQGFSLLEFAPLGILLTAAGFFYLIFIGRHLLTGNSLIERLSGGLLTEVYRLKERLFALQIPAVSMVAGRTLGGLRLGAILDLEVLAIKRHGNFLFSPGADDAVLAGDSLMVRGRSQELQKMLRISNASIKSLPEVLALTEQSQLGAVRFAVSKKILARGKSIGEIAFRAAYGFHIVSIERGDASITEGLSDQLLQEGDYAIAIGPIADLPRLEEVTQIFPLVLEDLSKEVVFVLELPIDSRLDHVKIRESGFSDLLSLTVIGVKRGKELTLSVSGDFEIQGGDLLIVAGQSDVVATLKSLIEIDVVEDVEDFHLEESTLLIEEVVLSPRSKLIGRSLDHIGFTKTYGVRVLGIWRDGNPKRTRFSKTPLQFGDALLLQGHQDKLSLLARDPDFVFLSESFKAPARPTKAKWAILSLVVLIALSAFQLFSPAISALIAASIVILSGTIRMEEGYSEVDWRLVTMVGCLLPFETAFSRYGLTDAVANLVSGSTSSHGLLFLILVLIAVTCVISQALDSTLAVIVMAPVAIRIAQAQHFLPQPFVLGIAVAASLGFLSPYSHRAHMLILGPGGYSNRDFFSVGWGLTVITVGLMALYIWVGL